jgi:hypothetical protein
MTHDVAYDALDTVRWMLAEQARELGRESAVGPDGRSRKKTKAQREREAIRFQTLCEVVWNVSGRSVPLDAVGEQARQMAMAA